MTAITKRRKRKKIKNSVSGTIFDIFNYSFIVLFCICIIFPVWNLLVISFSEPLQVSSLSLNFWPKKITFDSYSYAFNNEAVLIGFRNSIVRTVLGTVYHLLVCSMAAFALTRHEMPGRGIVMIIFLITMFFSGGTIPTYLTMKDLGLLNNFLVYILPGGFSIYNTIIIRNYFLSIDRALEEAASIDGASVMQTFLQIILPLSTPVLATVGLWSLVGQWNSWFDNMAYCNDGNLITLQYLLRKMNNEVNQMAKEMNQFQAVLGRRMDLVPETMIAATTVIVITPIICTYPFLQKYFVKGIMLGGVKG